VKRSRTSGGSAGLGASIASKLANEGCKVAINYANSTERAEKTLASLSGQGHVAIQADAFTKEGMQSLIAQAIEKLGGLDILILNSSWTKFGDFKDLNALEDDDWRLVYERNVLANLWATQAAEKELKKNQGAIVITSSRAGLIAGGSSMAYCASIYPAFVADLSCSRFESFFDPLDERSSESDGTRMHRQRCRSRIDADRLGCWLLERTDRLAGTDECAEKAYHGGRCR
jgi:NADP-dependent 3-hydroxy acid dehydrogenase YdfG